MRARETIFDFVGQILMIFGFSIICLNVFCVLFGDSAKGYSTIFELGGDGLSVKTMMQFLLTAIMIAVFRYLFFTEFLIKKASIGVRTIGMFFVIIVMMVLFVGVFGWFPLNMWKPWVAFFISFGISAAVSTIISVYREKIENQKMEEALERLKQGE